MQVTNPASHLFVERFSAVLHHVMQQGNGELLEAIDELGISLSQVKSLGALERKGTLSLKALGETLGLSLPAISRSVDTLVKRGWVTRQECESDRRSKLISITPAGSDTVRKLTELRFSGLRAFAESLDPEELAALSHAFDLLARRPEIAAHVSQEDPTR